MVKEIPSYKTPLGITTHKRGWKVEYTKTAGIVIIALALCIFVGLLIWLVSTYRNVLDQIQDVYDLIYGYSDDVNVIVKDYYKWYPVVEKLVDRIDCIQQIEKEDLPKKCEFLNNFRNDCKKLEENLENSISCANHNNKYFYEQNGKKICINTPITVLRGEQLVACPRKDIK